MTTAFEELESSISLISRTRTSLDSSILREPAIMEHSEPLLGDGAQDREIEPRRRSTWSRIPFLKCGDKQRRKASDRATEPDIMEKRKGSKRFLMFGVGILAVLGIVQLLSLFGNLIILVVPNRIHDIIGSWGKPGQIGAGLSRWPTDFTRDILPIPCHSHNDYWRKVPLYSAIEAGCISVEADIWLFTDELYVGHSVASLTPNRTLHSLYINPLLDILFKQNQDPLVIPDPNRPLHGVFDTTPEQPLVLLIDFKTSGIALFPHVVKALEPLRSKGYLTRWNGSAIIQGTITVVGTGETPFEMVTSDVSNPHHDIFFDAPLNEMSGGLNEGTAPSVPKISQPAQSTEGNESRTNHRRSEERSGKAISARVEAYTSSNSHYASVSFTEAIGVLLDGKFSDGQMDILRGQIRGAHERALKARYWELPFWPIDLRNHVWDVLVKEGVDLLNVDDLKGASKGNWAKRHGWWKQKK